MIEGIMKSMQGVNQDNALMDTNGDITQLGSWVSSHAHLCDFTLMYFLLSTSIPHERAVGLALLFLSRFTTLLRRPFQFIYDRELFSSLSIDFLTCISIARR